MTVKTPKALAAIVAFVCAVALGFSPGAALAAEKKREGAKPAVASPTPKAPAATAKKPAPPPADPFAGLRKRLLQDGVPRGEVAAFFDPAPGPHFKTVAATMRIREGALNYAQFLEPEMIGRAREFSARHAPELLAAETASGVDRNVIVAILLVETKLGQYTGRTPTLGILATFAAMNEKRNRDRVWAHLDRADRERWGRAKFDQKLKDRSEWAYRELRSLMKWAEGRPEEARNLEGSVMGAVGLAQFLPSNVLRYGMDGDGDGVVDLFVAADAIASVGNYLAAHGWRKDLPREAQEQVIFRYNRSTPYVETVLGVAEKLREAEGEAKAASPAAPAAVSQEGAVGF